MSYREILLNNLQAFCNDEQKIAIYSKDTNVSYKQLNDEVLNLSQHIIDSYGSDNEVIAVRMKDSLNAFEMILALLFSNKVVLPVPFEVPDEKAVVIFQDIKPLVIFTDGTKSYENSVDFYRFKKATSNKTFSPPKYCDDSRFIIIMTSGTTGNPKGCCLSDNAFLGRVYDLYEKFGFEENDNFLFSSNYSFDVSYTQILTWLFGKGSITIQKKGDDFRSIPDYVKAFKVTHLAMSPAVLKYVYSPLVEKTTSIKDVFVAGEKFPTIVAEKSIEQHPYFNLWNMYGPTEFSIYATFFNLMEYEKTDISVPIGYALEGVKIKLLDSQDNVISEDGVEGQILLGGKGCFSEYINKRDITLSSLIEIGGELFYKTGDLGCVIDKKLYFHGRKDHQLKINGIRVEAEEIERLIAEKCPEIESVIVKLLSYQSKNQLVAFAVLRNKNTHIDLSSIKNNIQTHIEQYFIPKVLHILDEIPLNKNGKIDNEKLQEIYISSKMKSSNEDHDILDVEITEVMRRIWQSVLNIQITDTHTSVFDLGADSMDIVILLGEIEDHFGITLQVEDVYRNPYLEDMASFVLLKINGNKISEINEQLIQKKINGYLQEVNTDFEKKIVLYSDTDGAAITNYIEDTYGIEYVPNYICDRNTTDLVHSKGLLDCSELTEVEQQEIRKLIVFQIEKNAEHLASNLCTNVFNTYECGPGQNKIFRKKYNDLVINKTRIETLCVEKIMSALNQLVKMHSLLRSMIIKHEERYFFKEFELRDDFKIEVLDLGQYKYKTACGNYVAEELFNYVGQMDKENNLLFRWLLVKKDEKTFELVSIFSHLIADAASSNVFSKEIILNFKRISEKTSIDKTSVVEYADYLDELKSNNSDEKYMQFVNSEKYAEIIKSSSMREKTRDLQINIIKVPVTFLRSPISRSTNNKEGILLWLSAQLASVILDKSKITFRITNNGRLLGNKRFDNVFGDCHVHFPLVIDSKKDNICTCFEKLVGGYNYYYVENKLYLEDLCYSQNSAENNKIEQMYDNLDFVFNYIGEMDERASEEYCRNASIDRRLYKTFYVYCYATRENFILNCRLPMASRDAIVQKFYGIINDWVKADYLEN